MQAKRTVYEVGQTSYGRKLTLERAETATGRCDWVLIAQPDSSAPAHTVINGLCQANVDAMKDAMENHQG